MIGITEISLSDCIGSTYSEEGSQAVEVNWHLSSCPGWEEVQLYTVCSSNNCTSLSGNIFSPHHVCGIPPGEYRINITAMNTCQEMVSDATNITLGKMMYMQTIYID